jgi:copper(I)-binding protein
MKLQFVRILLAAATLTGAWPAGAADSQASAITAHAAWARATPPGTSVAAVYLTLVGGSRPDRLVGAETVRAAMTQIHVVTEAEGMARMRPIDGVDVPARKTVSLAPQGTHLMLMNLKQPLVARERFPLSLQFESAGKVDVSVEVRGPGDAPPAAH